MPDPKTLSEAELGEIERRWNNRHNSARQYDVYERNVHRDFPRLIQALRASTPKTFPANQPPDNERDVLVRCVGGRVVVAYYTDASGWEGNYHLIRDALEWMELPAWPDPTDPPHAGAKPGNGEKERT